MKDEKVNFIWKTRILMETLSFRWSFLLLPEHFEHQSLGVSLNDTPYFVLVLDIRKVSRCKYFFQRNAKQART